MREIRPSSSWRHCWRATARLPTDFDLTPDYTTDVLVVGGGGAGCAAALHAHAGGAKVILATKLRLGDSNSVMAQGGMQISVRREDSPVTHFRGYAEGRPHAE